MMSLVVKAVGDGEDVGRPFVRLEDVLLLFEVSEVFDPVGAAGRRRRDEPIHGGFTALERTLQPIKPAERRPTQTLQGSKYECIYFGSFITFCWTKHTLWAHFLIFIQFVLFLSKS